MDFDSDYWMVLIEQIREIQEEQEIQASTSDQVKNVDWILILEKDNATKLVRDWIYPVAPTSYYDHPEILSLTIDEYELVETKDNRAYYKYVGVKK